MELVFLINFWLLATAGIYLAIQPGRFSRFSGIILLGQAMTFAWLLVGRIRMSSTPILGPGSQIYADPMAQSVLELTLLALTCLALAMTRKDRDKNV